MSKVISGVTAAEVRSDNARAQRNIETEIEFFSLGKDVKYNGRYVQVFRFVDDKVKSVEEYYNAAQLDAAYGS